MVRYFCEFVNGRHRQIIPLVRKLFDADFILSGVNGAGEVNLNDHLYEMRDDVCAAMERLSRYCRSCDGYIRLSLAEQTLIRLLFDADWRFELRLDLFDNPRADLGAVQRRALSAYEADDLDTILEAAAGFVDGVVGKDFGYELSAADKPFLRGHLAGRTITISMVNLATYLRLLLFFMRKSDLTLFARSPMDLLRLLEELQNFFRSMADTFEEQNLTIEVEMERQVVYRCGKGVKPNFGSRFGATSIQLDALARILAATVKRRGE